VVAAQTLDANGLRAAAMAGRDYLVSTSAADTAFHVAGDERLTTSLPLSAGQACFEGSPPPPAVSCLTWGKITKPVPINAFGTGSAKRPGSAQRRVRPAPSRRLHRRRLPDAEGAEHLEAARDSPAPTLLGHEVRRAHSQNRSSWPCARALALPDWHGRWLPRNGHAQGRPGQRPIRADAVCDQPIDNGERAGQALERGAAGAAGNSATRETRSAVHRGGSRRGRHVKDDEGSAHDRRHQAQVPAGRDTVLS